MNCDPPYDPRAGALITFEGVEGSGKTTQIGLLRIALESKGFSVLVTREPGGDEIGEAIRRVLLEASAPVTDRAELLLFMASRAQMVERILRPHLDCGDVVLCDRYIDSSVVYQGYARGLDVETIRGLNRFATSGITPSRTILLDLPAEQGLGRQMDRNRMESESTDFHRRVREGYLTEARRDPARIAVIDATGSVDQIHRDVVSVVLESLRRGETLG